MKRLILLTLLLTLIGCTPAPVELKPDEAKRLVEKIEFVKHPNGVCFGILNTVKINTALNVSESISLTTVDCDSVGLTGSQPHSRK